MILLCFLSFKLKKLLHINKSNKILEYGCIDNNASENNNLDIIKLNEELNSKNEKIYKLNMDLEDLEEKKSKDKKVIEQLKNQVSDLDSKLQMNNDKLKKKVE